MQTEIQVMYWVSSILLAIALYFPVSKVIWAFQARHMERKLGRPSSTEERQRMLRLARMLASLLVVTFSFFLTRSFFSQ